MPRPRGPLHTGHGSRGSGRGGSRGSSTYRGGFPPASISSVGNGAMGSTRGLAGQSTDAANQMRGGRGRGGRGGNRGGNRGGRGGGPRPQGWPLESSTGSRLGQLRPERLTRGRDGLITHIDGMPVDAWLKSETARRISHHRQNGTLSSDPYECIAVGVDLKTGRVYEGLNGERGNVIPPGGVHPFIDQRVNDIRNLPHIDRSGNLTVGQPHGDAPLRHAEVKAANEMLRDRDADARQNPNAYPYGVQHDRAVKQFAVNTHFPNSGVAAGGTQAPFCVNCNHILHGASAVQGRFTGNPPRDGLLVDNRYGPNWNP